MTRARQRLAGATAALGLLATLAACTSDPEQPTPDNPGGVIVHDDGGGRFLGAELASPYTMPDVTLEDTGSDDFNLVTDTTAPITLVFFGYTHCADVCPLVMSDLTLALSRVSDEVREQTQLVFVTTDPDRDTPDVLRSYLDRFDPAYVGLTGDLADIVAAAKAMGVGIEGHQRLPSGGYDVSHGSQVIGFSRDSAPVVWTEGTPVDDIVADLRTLAGP